METLQKFVATYSPSSIVNIFNNALTGDAVRKILRVKGVYSQGKGVAYSGYYYDTLKDESTEGSITLIVPALLRTSLIPHQTIECTAYVTKKAYAVGARIELQLNIIEVIEQMETKYTDEQLKGFQILQRKADAGYRDVDSFIKTKILKSETIKVTILIGKTAIIDSDIKHQLEEAIGFYQFEFIRINLVSENEIVEALDKYQSTDILCISRGGGDNLNIFDSPSIAEAALEVLPFFITAIGHKENTPLLQKIADKSFITPTALGQYFNDIYNETVEQLQNSKAKLVEDITRQLKGNYEKQIQNLNEKLSQTEELNRKAIDDSTLTNKKEIELFQSQIETIRQIHTQQLLEVQKIGEEKLQFAYKQLEDTKGNRPQQSLLVIFCIIIAAVILGVIIGKIKW